MRTLIIVSAALAAGLSAMPAAAQDYRDGPPSGGYRDGPPPERRMDDIRLEGRGVPLLAPELRDSPRGRAFVMRRFDFNRDGLISPREAQAANRAFANFDRGRDRFGDDGPGGPGPVVVEERVIEHRGPLPPVGWDRRAMHDYGFRQTPRGATLNLDEDVLFATDSATLRPGAVEKLRALAGYLGDQRGVRIAIDGYTDSRGSDAHNQDLSERRAASVRDALVGLGVVRARFAITGHGERDPIASNATPQGMRQNRRVEVTLLGQRADAFAGY